MPSAPIIPIVSRRMRALCVAAYPLHPKGCPKYGKCDSCPPAIRFFEDYFDLSQPVYAVWNVFPIGEHVERMRAAHPDWSERQLFCVLYWQAGARKQLEGEIAEFLLTHPELVVTRCPEAMGLNVTETLSAAGVALEWPPVRFALQVAVAGTPGRLLPTR
jgi:hypothetical protein